MAIFRCQLVTASVQIVKWRVLWALTTILLLNRADHCFTPQYSWPMSQSMVSSILLTNVTFNGHLNTVNHCLNQWSVQCSWPLSYSWIQLTTVLLLNTVDHCLTPQYSWPMSHSMVTSIQLTTVSLNGLLNTLSHSMLTSIQLTTVLLYNTADQCLTHRPPQYC